MGSRKRWGWGGLGWNERRSVCTGVNWGTKEEWERRMKRKRERRNEGRREHFRATVTASCYCPPAGGDRGSLAMHACAHARVHVCMLKLLQGACKICTFGCV